MLAELQQAAVTLQTNECKADKQVDEWYGGYKTNNVYRRLGAGRLLGDFRDQMNASVNGSTLKVALYGCHDTTLGSMLTSIGAFDDKWPPFTSHVALELFEQKATSLAGYFGSKDYFVRVRYNNEVMPVPACKNPNLCTMKEFNKVCLTFGSSHADRPDCGRACPAKLGRRMSRRRAERDNLGVVTGVYNSRNMFGDRCNVEGKSMLLAWTNIK